ncbi:MAG: F-type H+-transporting ATPase subunit a [Nocardioidaceae bacterium]|jgi:F-type H+-transporting ATPase subunit a|nr:F-type H+-transporting ATPase subunit a [Nocardioidaceae bacterium]
MSASVHTVPLADTSIEVGHHITAKFLGLTFNVDTIWSTALAAAIVVGLCLVVAAKSSVTAPSKVQLAWEFIMTYLTKEVEGSLGRVNRFVLELAVVLFTFILLSNWLELIPTGDNPHYLPSPTADVNLTYALALFVIVGVHIHSFRQKGFRGYFSYYSHGPKILIPLTVIEEIVKPFTLALRLFGNIFAGGIMLAIIGLIPIWGFWGPNLLWKAFDLFIGAIQAFIFALLTIIYFGQMSQPSDDHADSQHTAGSPEPETTQRELSGAH